MTQEEYINSLTIEELRYVVNQFWDWVGNDGCPIANEAADKDYICEEENKINECWDFQEQQLGCWVKYYVWKYHNSKEQGK